MQKTDVLPGYTGYRPQFKEEEFTHPEIYQGSNKHSQVPGYQGYIAGVKSENVFSMTYGRSTEAAATGHIQRGFDLSDQEKYVSVSQLAFTSQMPLRKNILKDFPFDEKPASPKRAAPQHNVGSITMSYEEACQAAMKSS